MGEVAPCSESCKAEVYTSLPELLEELGLFAGPENCDGICGGAAELCGDLVFPNLGLAGGGPQRLKEDLGVATGVLGR